MDSLLNRYRNVTVLLLVIFAQLVLLAWQVRSGQDVRLIRVWAVTAVTPMAKVIDTVRSGTVGTVEKYVNLHDVSAENRQLKEENDRLKIENQYLRSELETADRVKALSAFQERSPSRTIAARVIGSGTGSNSRVVFVDRGSGAGVQRGMAVITPDGIVGKVVAAYPTASQVMLVTDPNFAAGVISQKHRVRGTVRGLGHSTCQVEYIQNEEQVEKGERFFTSGDDGVFPKGLPVGAVTIAKPGDPYKQVFVTPAGLQGGLEEVLIILEGAHQPIPNLPQAAAEVHVQPPPPEEPAPAAAPPASAPAASGTPATAAPKPASAAAGAPVGPSTDADRLRDRYRRVGEAQGHKFGEGTLGSRPPDFNITPEAAAKRAAEAAAAAKARAAAAGAGASQQQAGGVAKPAAPKPPAAKPAQQP